MLPALDWNISVPLKLPMLSSVKVSLNDPWTVPRLATRVSE